MHQASAIWYTVHPAGKFLNRSPAAVRAACDRGEIQSIRTVSGTRLIHADELRRVLEARMVRDTARDRKGKHHG